MLLHALVGILHPPAVRFTRTKAHAADKKLESALATVAELESELAATKVDSEAKKQACAFVRCLCTLAVRVSNWCTVLPHPLTVPPSIATLIALHCRRPGAKSSTWLTMLSRASSASFHMLGTVGSAQSDRHHSQKAFVMGQTVISGCLSETLSTCFRDAGLLLMASSTDGQLYKVTLKTRAVSRPSLIAVH